MNRSAIFDESLNELFTGAKYIDIATKPSANFFKHPIEKNESVENRVDHIIFLPVELSVSMAVVGDNYLSLYQDIKQAYTTQTKLVVQTKVDVYEDMYIQSMPHKESADNADGIILDLSLVETLISETQVSFSPSNTKDGNTLQRGKQQGQAVNSEQEERGSTLYRVFS